MRDATSSSSLTSKSFAENAIVWKARPRAPVATVPITLPWVTGAKYSWFARMRAVVDGEPGEWSKKYGFNIRPSGAPRSLSSGVNATPGMVRWTPVNGATGYDVVFLFDQGSGKTKRIRTATTAADLREMYTFHNTLPSSAPVFWRVRAVREVSGKTKNKLPAVSFGPLERALPNDRADLRHRLAEAAGCHLARGQDRRALGGRSPVHPERARTGSSPASISRA